MSKAMVAMNTGSQNELVALKRGRKEIVSQNNLNSWLEEARSGKNLISTVLLAGMKKKNYGIGDVLEREAEPVSKAAAWAYSSPMALFGALSGFGGSWVINASSMVNTSTTLPVSFGEAISVSLIGAAVLGSGFFSWLWSASKKDKAIWDNVVYAQSDGLRAWLHTRHDIIVSDEILQKVAIAMLKFQRSISFMDVDGHKWVLRVRDSGDRYQLEPAPIDVKTDVQVTSLQQAPVKIVVGTSSLPEPAQKIIDSIDVRLSQLHKFALSTEQSHVVARSVEDAREAVAAFERLDALGAGASGLERLVSILSLLDRELERIVQSRIAEESAGFALHQQSVEARMHTAEV
jgi:hypothetical protein